MVVVSPANAGEERIPTLCPNQLRILESGCIIFVMACHRSGRIPDNSTGIQCACVSAWPNTRMPEWHLLKPPPQEMLEMRNPLSGEAQRRPTQKRDPNFGHCRIGHRPQKRPCSNNGPSEVASNDAPIPSPPLPFLPPSGAVDRQGPTGQEPPRSQPVAGKQ